KMFRTSDGTIVRTFASRYQCGGSLSPDGNLLAESDSSGFAHVWNVHDGSLAITLPRGRVFFSPDGALLTHVAADVDVTTIWRIPDWNILYAIQGRAISFSRDGQVIAIDGEGRRVRFYRAADGLDVSMFTISFAGVVVFGDDWVVASDGFRLTQYSFPGGRILGTLDYFGLGISLSLSGDGDLLAVGEANRIRLVRMPEFTVIRTLTTPGTYISLSVDGSLLAVSTGSDTTSSLYLLSIPDGMLVRVL